MNTKCVVKLDRKNISGIEGKISRALIKTADAVKTDVMNMQVMPFDTGALQNRSTFVDKSKADLGDVYIVNDTPYARRLYFHPEYNFSREKNAKAGGEWYKPYEEGTRKDYIQTVYERFLKQMVGD